jgi:hypothetical protein
MTPSRQANRRGFYMVTDETTQHPWLREDVGLRAAMAGETFERAAELLHAAAEAATRHATDLERQERDVRRAALISTSLARGLLAHRHDG